MRGFCAFAFRRSRRGSARGRCPHRSPARRCGGARWLREAGCGCKSRDTPAPLPPSGYKTADRFRCARSGNSCPPGRPWPRLHRRKGPAMQGRPLKDPQTSAGSARDQDPQCAAPPCPRRFWPKATPAGSSSDCPDAFARWGWAHSAPLRSPPWRFPLFCSMDMLPL